MQFCRWIHKTKSVQTRFVGGAGAASSIGFSQILKFQGHHAHCESATVTSPSFQLERSDQINRRVKLKNWLQWLHRVIRAAFRALYLAILFSPCIATAPFVFTGHYLLFGTIMHSLHDCWNSCVLSSSRAFGSNHNVTIIYRKGCQRLCIKMAGRFAKIFRNCWSYFYKARTVGVLYQYPVYVAGMDNVARTVHSRHFSSSVWAWQTKILFHSSNRIWVQDFAESTCNSSDSHCTISTFCKLCHPFLLYSTGIAQEVLVYYNCECSPRVLFNHCPQIYATWHLPGCVLHRIC